MTDSNATTPANVGVVHARGRLALLTLAALACLGIATAVLSNIGVCFPEGKILSDKDYFKGAIHVVIHDPVDGAWSRMLPELLSLSKFIRRSIPTLRNFSARIQIAANLFRQIQVTAVPR
jgi:hypothetical protein